MASNQSGSAVAEAFTAVPSDDVHGQWLPKQRSVAVDSTILGMPGPTAPAVMDPGECLRTRILEQVRQTKAAAEQERAAQEAVARAKETAAQRVRDEAARKKTEEATRRQAEAAAAERAEEERRARLALSYVKPVTSYSLASDFGGGNSPWTTTNTGQDFAVPTGTPAMAIHSGTVTSAGWAGSFGYRVVLTLDCGTQLWYCHLSSMVKTAGRVVTGDVIGRVGATGNTAGPHLHLEVRPGGGEPVDPLEWLRAQGVAV